MKKIILTILLAISSIISFAQESNEYVNWKFTVKRMNPQFYEIRLTATIASGWHIYAQGKDAAPIPTSITFTTNPLVTTLGVRPTEAGRLIKSTNKFYPVKYYEKMVAFVQKVKVKDDTKTTVSGSIKFMVSNGTAGMSPSTVNFSVEVGK